MIAVRTFSKTAMPERSERELIANAGRCDNLLHDTSQVSRILAFGHPGQGSARFPVRMIAPKDDRPRLGTRRVRISVAHAGKQTGLGLHVGPLPSTDQAALSS
jgi:hypothetical protein